MKLELIKASDVEIKEVEWLWYPYIPYGKVTVLQGDSGDGKSTFVLNLAAMLSRGRSRMAAVRSRSISSTSPLRTMQTIPSCPALSRQEATRTD